MLCCQIIYFLNNTNYLCLLIIVNDENSQTVILIFHHHIHRFALVTHLTFLIAWHLEEEKLSFTQLTHHQICIEAQRYDSNLSTLSGKADFCYDMQHHHDQTESPSFLPAFEGKAEFLSSFVTHRHTYLEPWWLSIYWYGNSRVFCSLSSRPAWIWR